MRRLLSKCYISQYERKYRNQWYRGHDRYFLKFGISYRRNITYTKTLKIKKNQLQDVIANYNKYSLE